MNKNNANIALAVFALLVVGFAVWHFMGTKKNISESPSPTPGQPGNPSPVPTGINTGGYFEDKIVTLARNQGPLPIEGFDAQMLIKALPGLTSADFAGVQTIGGQYELKSGELVLNKNSEPPTSADRTVTQEGYKTLLDNLSKRFNLSAKTTYDIDGIIQKINTSEIITAQIGQTVPSGGIKIAPQDILEDSRCPVDVNCIQAGTVRMSAIVYDSKGNQKNIIFKLDQLSLIDSDYSAILTKVEPNKTSGKTIEKSSYKFYFQVIRNS